MYNWFLVLSIIFVSFAKSYQYEDLDSNHHPFGKLSFVPADPIYLNRYYHNPGNVVRSLDRLGGGEVLRSLGLDSLSGGEILRYPEDQLEWGGARARALDRLSGGEVLKSPKRSLDTLSGMSFGESKRFDSLSGTTFGHEKRDFDEIDHVGFNRFQKRKSPFNKRNFDEIDHAGFGGFVKRNADGLRSYVKHFNDQQNVRSLERNS